MSTTNHSTRIAETEIVYDRVTKDFAIKVNGQTIAWAPSYSQAEAIRTRYLADTEYDNE